MRPSTVILFAVAVAACNSAYAQFWPDTVGYTQYDLQSSGSVGERIALDGAGGVHFTWMNASPYPTIRGVAYNYRSPSGDWAGGMFVFQSGAGYPQLALTTDDRAVIVFHRSQPSGAESVYCAVDLASGFGYFDIFRPPIRIDSRVHLWPHVSRDISGRLHVTATHYPQYVGDPLLVMYTRSNDGGTTWVAPQAVDRVMTRSTIVVASRVSGKVAIVYLRHLSVLLPLNNDVYYIQSLDGATWDFLGGRVNVTNYGGNSDSLWANTDCDAVYDYDDNLHIIWTAQPLYGGIAQYPVRLFHYSVASGVITAIASGDYSWPDSGCDFGQGNVQVCKMSLGVHEPTNNICAIYTRFDSSDCSAGGYANGDIYAQLSSDGGASWFSPLNLTNSRTPGCEAGDCDSDNWASLSERINENLHIFYVNDKDAGSIPYGEGQVTDNPLLYIRVPVDLLGVSDEAAPPRDFVLRQNYPNPFNAATRIEFALKEASHISLSIFDVRGDLIKTLIDKQLSPGNHSVVWDAEYLSSGTYYYSLKTVTGSETKKMILLK